MFRKGVLRRFTPTPDVLNQPVKVFADLATVHCQFIPDQPSEAFDEGQERAAWAHAKFLLRWRSDLTPTVKDVFVYQGKTFDILGVTETERCRTWELKCRARAEA